jgi:hypothetical protein
MNKILKIILISINIAMLGIAISWYLENNEKEPFIVGLGQIATLLILIFENKASKIITRRISNNADVDVDVQAGDHVKTTDVDNSKVKIKTNR